jgi:oligopeptide transport system substrate-binding protein
MRCDKCGTPLSEDAVFCRKCGARVEKGNTMISFDDMPGPKKPRRNYTWLIVASALVLAGLLIYGGIRILGTPSSAQYLDAGNQEEQAVQPEETGDGEVTGDTEEQGDSPFQMSSQGIVVNWGAEPPDLDPQTSTDQVSFWILNATLEGLVRQNPDGSVGAGLAESWDISSDQCTYTFHLRDAKWSDGTPVTAGDFEYAWKRAIDPATASEYAYQMYYIVNAAGVNNGAKGVTLDDVGVRALDDKTLEVVLEQPTPFFLSLTSFITYLPAQQEAVERWGDDYGTELDKMVYCGPFVVSKWNHEQELTLAKNEQYWDADSVRLAEIKGLMIDDENTVVQMYESGELDIMAVGATFLDKYIDSSEYNSMPQAVTWYLMFNCQDKYFSNLKIRKAFSMATDRQTYVDQIRMGLGALPTQFTPGNMAGKGGKMFMENVANAGVTSMPGYDPVIANQLLDEGLREIGATRRDLQRDCTIVGGEGDVWTTYLQFLQGQWEQNLGVRLRIESMSFAERLDRYDQGTYQITYAGWGGDYNDPMTFMDMWVTGGGNNDAWWSDAAYDAAIETAKKGQGDARIDAMVQAEGILAEQLPIYPVIWPTRSYVQKSYVHDVVRLPVGADTEFKWAWVEAKGTDM